MLLAMTDKHCSKGGDQPMQHTYSYEGVLATSERLNWRIEDIIGGDKRMDFGKPFLPESLARVDDFDFLSTREKRTLNQIRGHAYLNIFGLVEEFILPFVMDHARAHLNEDDDRTRALLQFAGEEAKHIQLFKRFRVEFTRGFGIPCEVIGPPEAVADAVLAQDPLGVALAILHIEWMTQRHYVDSVKDDQDLDPQFKSLLKHHWQEEAQHAKLDTLMVEALAEGRTSDEIGRGVAGYMTIGGMIDDALKQQVAFDQSAFETATGRVLTEDEEAMFQDLQHQANRWTYLGSGMTHPNFLATVGRIGPAIRSHVEQMAPAFC